MPNPSCRLGVLLCVFVLSVVSAGARAAAAQTPEGGTFRISGTVEGEGGGALGGVTLTLGGASNVTTTTAVDGRYSFDGLTGGGTYTVTPARSNYRFEPQSQTFGNLSADVTANFIGGPSGFEVSGSVTGGGAAGLGGITLVLVSTRNHVTTTASDGGYKFTDIPPGTNFTVFPYLPGQIFSPSFRGFSNLSRNVVANFSAAPALYGIGGKVVSAGAGVGGVPVRLSGARTASATTASDGSYSFTGLPAGGDFSVTIPYPDGMFTNYLPTAPGTYSFDDLSADITADFGVVLLRRQVGGLWSSRPAVGDFNGDGKVDVVTVGEAVKMWLGNGDGTFRPSGSQVAATTLNGAATTGDFNHDGKLDLVAVTLSHIDTRGTVQVFLGGGDGSLTPTPDSYAVGYNPFDLAARDIDGDGKLDLVVPNYYGNSPGSDSSNGNFSVMTGRGDGSFASPVSYHAGALLTSLAVGDFNGDGRADLAFSTYFTGDSVRLFLNRGDGTFGSPLIVFTAISSTRSAAGDFNGDGKLDLALTTGILGSDKVNTVLGNGDGTFRPPVENAAGTTGTHSHIIADDFNGDGKRDLLVQAGEMNLLAGNGDGTFARGVNIVPGSNFASVLAADYNGDGRKDFALATSIGAAGELAVMLNNPARPSWTTHTLSGRLLDGGGNPLAGVTVALGGAQPGSALTAADGTYTLRAVAAGNNVTLTPSKALYDFQPTSQTLTVNGDASGVDFTATRQRFAVTGRVTERGNALAGVTVSLDALAPGGQAPLTTTTGGDGTYAFTGVPAGVAYTVTPLRTNYGFAPAGQGVLVTSDRPGINFAAVALPTAVQFALAATGVNEGGGHAVVTVTRTGGVAGVMSVDYATADDAAAVRCDDTRTLPGVAFARCDYSTTVGTLAFAAGETQKAIDIPLIDDGHDEGAEVLRLKLSNPVGVSLGSQQGAAITLEDNDGAAAGNPVFSPPFFVRQHYLDFLSRLPEPGGYDAWLRVLENCPDAGGDPTCDRITVSSSFFGSQEFQLKGSYVFRFYKLAFGRLPLYEEIIPDMSFVSGADQQEVFQRKAQLAERFTQRTEFKSAYGGLTNSAYVAALLGRYGLAQITTPDPSDPDGAQKVTFTGVELVGRLNGNTLSRGQAFRAIADSDQVGAAEFNRAFVAMQYYGYLRRTPEEDGYQAWLRVINQDPNNIRIMVAGFLNSTEYRLRFGRP